MDPQALVAALLERVWSEGDAEAADALIAPAYTIRHDPGDPWEGQTLDRAGYRDRVVKSRAAFPDQRFTIIDSLASEDKVMVSWTWVATHLGDLPGIAATGRTITMSGATVYHFEDGLACGHWQVTDRLGVYRQISA